MAKVFEYHIGDRVSLALEGAYGAEQWTGTLGTVARVIYRVGRDPLYHVVLDEPITNPSLFFTHLSADGLSDNFDPKWLAPAPGEGEEEEIEIGSLADVL